MRKIIIYILFFITVGTTIIIGQIHEGISYLHPLPNSKLHSQHTTVILRLNNELNQLITDLDNLIQLSNNSTFQIIPGQIIWSSDDRTIIFKPNSELNIGTEYKVIIQSSQVGLSDYEYTFSTAKSSSNPPVLNKYDPETELQSAYFSMDQYKEAKIVNGNVLPNWFPEIDITQNGETATGYLSFAARGNWGNYLMMIDNDGYPYFYREYPIAGNVLLHYTEQHPKGLLTGFMGPNRGYYIFNHNFEHIDTYFSGHGYTTDNHEIEIKPNGHVLLIAAQNVYVDVSSIISGGNTNAKVQYKHFQEFDLDHNVIFEWRSIDYFNISDAIGVPLTESAIDNVHMNAIDVDFDSHYLISSKTMDEITKINSETGEIIWRFGGVNNQFEILGEEYTMPYFEGPYPIAWQHDVRAVPGKPGEYTFFDNRNYGKDGSPVPEAFSRAAHYILNTDNMTAEKVWEFRMTPDLYNYGKSSTQLLPNGNYYIDWTNKGNGEGSDQQSTQDILGTEVTPQGEIVYQFRIENANTYRSRRHNWDGYVLTPELYIENYGDYVRLLYNKFGDKNVDTYKVYYGASPSPTELFATTSDPYYDFNATRLASGRKYYFRITAVDSSGLESDYSNEESTTVNYSGVEPGQNMIVNGDFTDGFNFWEWDVKNGANAQNEIDSDGQLHINISSGGNEYSNVQVKYSGIPLNLFQNYIFQFDAYADGNRAIEAEVFKNSEPFTNFSQLGLTTLTREKQTYTYEFKMNNGTTNDAQVVFNTGNSDIDVYIDNVVLKQKITTNVEDEEKTPLNYKLNQNYPNPFNPETTIKFQLPEPSSVQIIVYNVLGEVVKELVNKVYSLGDHTTSFVSNGIPSGVYYYKINAQSLNGNNNFNSIKKMIILK